MRPHIPVPLGGHGTAWSPRLLRLAQRATFTRRTGLLSCHVRAQLAGTDMNMRSTRHSSNPTKSPTRLPACLASPEFPGFP